jgi:hypothetical protein
MVNDDVSSAASNNNNSAAIPFPTLTILYLPAEASHYRRVHRIFPRGATSVQKGYHLEPGHRQPVAQRHYCKDKRACQRRVCDARVRRHDVRSLVGNRLQTRISLKLCNDRKIMYSIIITDATVDRNRWVKELSQAPDWF